MFEHTAGSEDHVAEGSPSRIAGGFPSRLRARLQPCRNSHVGDGALAPEGVLVSGTVPQRLKPRSAPDLYGTAEAVPLSKTSLLHRIFSIRQLRLAQLALVFSLAIVVLGAGDTSEKRFERVGHNMMCVCGCGQILLECNHVGCPDSERMRKELQAQIPGSGNTPGDGAAGGSGFGSGGSDKQIMEWFVAKYGAVVLAAPLRGGFDNVAWITPIALFLLAILGTTLIIRVWKSRQQQRAPLKIKGMSAASTDELRERIRRETLY